MSTHCAAGVIPANPDIAGIGIRVAIYVQNFLSFIPAFYSLLNGGKVDMMKLQTVEKQSTTILVTAFAILISLIVHARTFGLSGFHTSIVLNLSWMNNTNTFIYFLLYIHHKSDPEQEKHINPTWSDWIRHVRQHWARHHLHAKTLDEEFEMRGSKDSKLDVELDQQASMKRVDSIVHLKPTGRFFRKVVLSLGSLHLTLMAVIGIWFWSSPELFETIGQSTSPTSGSLDCTFMAVLGSSIAMSSPSLRIWSLLIYASFVVPILNLIMPAAIFLALHIGYHRIKKRDAHRGHSVVPIYLGLVFLLAINVVFLIDIETMIHWTKQLQANPTEESEWTFGQTLAILLLALPLRDVSTFIVHVRTLKRHERRRVRCTEELKDALDNGNMEKVKMVARYADIRAEASGSFPTALQFAAYEGELDLVQFLVRNGANLDTEGREHGSALTAAIMNGNDDVAVWLLEAGTHIDLSDASVVQHTSMNGLHGTLKWLLEHGVDINIVLSSDRQTPLHVAAEYGHVHTVQLLLNRGVKIELIDQRGRTPLHMAARNGHENVVATLLVRGVDIEVGDETGKTSLHMASEHGHEPAVKELLNGGANFNITDHDKRTAMYLAAMNGHEPTVKTLLNRGADTEVGDREGWTPLHMAATGGHESTVKTLLEGRANVEPPDRIWRTPLHLAAEKGHDKIVKTLLAGGANIEMADGMEWTALHWAAKYGREPVVKTLLNDGAKVNATDRDEHTALHLAAANGWTSVVRTLLDGRADTEISDEDGRTPLHLSVEQGREAAVETLLDGGANINSTDNNRRTPLHWAVNNGHEALVKTLIAAGADLEITDRFGLTPSRLATDNGDQTIMKMLQENVDMDPTKMMSTGTTLRNV